jgi:hypothetical protein
MNDPYVQLVEEASRSTSLATIPGAFLVDIFPSSMNQPYCYGSGRSYYFPLTVKYIPEWMPGGGFKKQAREWRKLSEAMVEVPYKMVKDRHVSASLFCDNTFMKLRQINKDSGNATTCFVTTCLERNANPDSKGTLREDLIKHTAAVAYAAGRISSLSSLTC